MRDPELVALSLEAHQNPFLFAFLRRLVECRDAVPAMRGREDLDVQPTCNLKNQPPEIGLDRVMEAVFHLVNQEYPILCIYKSQRDPEHAVHAIAQASEG